MNSVIGRYLVVGVIIVTAAPAGAKTPEGEGIPCSTDDQCPRRTICDTERGRCTRIRRHINLLYMVYRSADRSFTEVMGIYWHRKGQRGYRVVFPLYWSFWSQESRHRVLAPFYFDHRTKESRRLVIPPVEVHRTPTEKTVRVWPLVYHTDRGAQGYSTTVVPFAHVARTGKRRTVVLPPILSYARTDPERDLSQGMVAGLFHWKSEKDQLSLGMLPLFWHRRSPGRRLTWVAPLNFHIVEKDQLSLGMLPLFWHRRSPGRRFTWVAPLNFHYSDETSNAFLSVPLLLHLRNAYSSTTLGLAPVPFYHHRSDDKRRFYLPPVTFYHRTGKRWLFTLGPTWVRRSPLGGGFGVPPLFADWNERRRWLVLFPALWHHQSQQSSTWVVGPGYYHRSKVSMELDPARKETQSTDRLNAGLAPLLFYSRRPGASSLTLLPLFSSISRSYGKRRTFLSPLVIYERDQDAGRSQLLLTAPIYYHLRDRWRSIDVAPPFFARWRDHERDTTTWLGLGGALVYHRTPRTSAQVLFPLWWRFANREHGTHTTVLGPGFYHRARDGWQAGLAPLLFAGRRGERRHVGFLPAFWHHAGPERSTTWVAPFNFYRRVGERRHLVLAPLLFAGWSPERRHLVLPPLFWHFRSPGRATWFVGPGYYHRDGEELDAGFAPLAFYRRRIDGRSLTVFPLFHHGISTDGKRRRFFSPLFAYQRDAELGRTQWALFAPLPYYHRRDPKLHVDLLLPLFGWWHDLEQKKRTYVIGGALVLHESPTIKVRTLFPLVWDVQDRLSGRRTSALIPVAYRRREPDGSSLSLVGPTFFKRRPGDEGWSAGLVPLLFAGRRGDRRHQIAVPIFWRFTGPESNFTLAGPVLWRRRGESRLGGVLPLVLAGRWNGIRFATIPPLLFHHHSKATGERFTMAGPYTGWSSPEGGTAHSVWPLIHYRRRGAAPQHTTDLSVIPLFNYRREPGARRLITPAGGFSWNEERTIAVAGPVYVRRGKETSTVAAVPLGFVRWKRGGFSRQHQMGLLPLFYAAKTPGRRALYTPLFGFRKQDDPKRSLWYAGSFFATRSQERSFNVLAPLVVHKRNHLRGRTTLYVFPSYFGRWSKERSTHVLAPLLWRWRRPQGSTTVVAPVLWDVHHRGVSRTTLVFPLYLRRRNEVAGTTTHLSHLTWVRRTAHGTDAVLFPIFWHFGGRASRSSTVAFPLLWHFRRPGNRSTVVFPVYWDFVRGERRTTVVLNTLYRRNKSKRTYDFHFLPLVRVQRKRPQDLKLAFLAGLFGYERIGRNKMLKLFLIPIDITR